MKSDILQAITTFAFVGKMRPAPGTWGSAVGLAAGCGIVTFGGVAQLVLAILVITALGFWAVEEELKDRPGEDPAEIVIDEVAGMWVALLFPAVAFWIKGVDMVWPGPLAAFLFFRLFDIWKPWHVGQADERGDAKGVMLDDLWAGLYAGVCTIIAAAIYHGVMFILPLLPSAS